MKNALKVVLNISPFILPDTFWGEKNNPLKYIQYTLLAKSVHLQHWNLQLLVT